VDEVRELKQISHALMLKKFDPTSWRNDLKTHLGISNRMIYLESKYPRIFLLESCYSLIRALIVRLPEDHPDAWTILENLSIGQIGDDLGQEFKKIFWQLDDIMTDAAEWAKCKNPSNNTSENNGNLKTAIGKRKKKGRY
jgi:hypothetical protein